MSAEGKYCMRHKEPRARRDGLAHAERVTPRGRVEAWASAEGVVAVEWMPDRSDCRAGSSGVCSAACTPPLCRDWAAIAVQELSEYLAGERRDFTVPVDLSGVTDFSRLVLEECRRLPYGQTLSYGELAAALGRPKAARAVGQALGRNPVPLIVPCHRILAAGGGLGGFGLGLEAKRRLLELEGREFS